MIATPRSSLHAAAILFAALARAQAVLLVGPGGFAQIDPAIAAAAPGDFIRVAAGTYGNFTCNKGVTIAALPGAVVDIVTPFSFPFPPLATVFQVPAGQSARVRELHFRSPQFGQVQGVRVLGGEALFESCTFGGGLQLDELLRVQNASVWLRDCQLAVGQTAFPSPALRALNSRIAAVDCTFRGSDLLPDGSLAAGDGIAATATSLHLVRCTAQGGNTTLVSCFYPAGDGVRTDRGDLTWIADSTLRGGNGYSATCGQGGNALHNTGIAPVHLARTSLVPGAGVPPGVASIGPTIADRLIGLATPSLPVQLGAAYQVDWQTDPNGTLLVLFSLDLVPLAPQVTVETTWLSANGFLWFATVTADAAGKATLQTAIPNVQALQDLGVWLHAVDLSMAPWHVGAPVGGMLR